MFSRFLTRTSNSNVRPAVAGRVVRSWAACVNLVLLVAILPFGLFGWSLHSLLPGHQHSTCGHVIAGHFHESHTQLSHSHSGHSNHSGHDHSGHDHSHHGTHSHAVESDKGPASSSDSIHAIHDCELCKVLQQLRSSQFEVQVFANGEIQIPLCWIRQQNSIVASLTAYYLRGPPIA